VNPSGVEPDTSSYACRLKASFPGKGKSAGAETCVLGLALYQMSYGLMKPPLPERHGAW